MDFSDKDLVARLREAEQLLADTRKKLDGAQTELEAHEGLLRYAMDDMRRIYEDLMKTQAQLLQADKLATIGLLTAGIIHEINSPLSASRGLLMLIDESLGKAPSEINFDDLRKFSGQSLDCLERAFKIVAGIKTFSRSDRGVMAPQNLNNIIESVIDLVWNQIKYRMELKREYGQVPLVSCNAQQIGQVILNLLVNAAQAIEDRGTITIRTYLKGDFACADVEDTGCGIPPEALPRIFEPFFTTKEDRGTGLGLSICLDIVKKHGGTIDVESKPGQGTRFTISIPTIVH